ncbi:hypothetical protein [Psychrilyobacter sp.]|uniref:hypothetical protein n=1 Tax=Psychrilyobacter sp. TaxID=2586924 RepID=UPI00301629EF
MSAKIKDENYNDLKTKEIVLDKEYPVVTNSAFIPYLNSKNKDIFNENNYDKIQARTIKPIIFLNVFPQDGKTYILISYFKSYEALFSVFLEDFSENVETSISMMIIRNCENVGFNPDYIENNFTEKEIKNILENTSFKRIL